MLTLMSALHGLPAVLGCCACGKGSKVVLVPLPSAVGRAIDQAAGNRSRGPVLLNSRSARMDRHAATRRPHQLAQAADIHVTRAHPHMLSHTFVICTAAAGRGRLKSGVGSAVHATAARRSSVRRTMVAAAAAIFVIWLIAGCSASGSGTSPFSASSAPIGPTTPASTPASTPAGLGHDQRHSDDRRPPARDLPRPPCRARHRHRTRRAATWSADTS